jgi:hypothetical protein
MADIKIAKIKIRRGLDADRKTVIFDQGEPVYSQDTDRLYIGDGVSAGGLHISNKTHPPILNVQSLTALNAERGDICYADGIIYQLTAADSQIFTNWSNISPRLDDNTVIYNGSSTISIAPSGVGLAQIDPLSFDRGIEHIGTSIRLKHSTSFNSSSANTLMLSDGGVDEMHLTSTITNGVIVGGAGDKIELNYDSTYFLENTAGELTLVDTPSFGYPDMDPNLYGVGFYFNNVAETINHYINDVKDTGSIVKDGNYNIDLETLYLSSNNSAPFSDISVDVYGRVSGLSTSINDTLSALSAADSSTHFNGTPNQTVEGYPITDLTQVTGLSSNGVTSVSVELSSAGFITFDGEVDAKSGKTIPRFAIPIYTF